MWLASLAAVVSVAEGGHLKADGSFLAKFQFSIFNFQIYSYLCRPIFYGLGLQLFNLQVLTIKNVQKKWIL